jgi:hypothetical protein
MFPIPPKETLLAASILRILTDYALFVVRGSPPFSAPPATPTQKSGLNSTGRAGIDWGFYGVPETFIVRGNGVIAYKVIGSMNAGTLDSVIRRSRRR